MTTTTKQIGREKKRKTERGIEEKKENLFSIAIVKRKNFFSLHFVVLMCKNVVGCWVRSLYLEFVKTSKTGEKKVDTHYTFKDIRKQIKMRF